MQTILWTSIVVSLAIYYLIWYWGHRGHRQIATWNACCQCHRRNHGVVQGRSLRRRVAKRVSPEAESRERTGVLLLLGRNASSHGRLPEAEDFLSRAIPLQKEPRLKARAANTLGLVLLDQGRYEEAIASHEESLHLWPDRGFRYRAIAEALLRDKREPTRALQNANRAVETDRAACGLEPKVLNCRIGEDLATLAWAVAANSGAARQVESLLAEAFPLCADQAKAIQAQVHYHAGQAYLLCMPEKRVPTTFAKLRKSIPTDSSVACRAMH